MIRSSATAGSESCCSCPLPLTVWKWASTYFMLCSGVTQGPPDWLQPGQLNMPSSISRPAAVFMAVWVMSHHSSENSGTRISESSSVDWLPMKARVMPTRFMASRSLTTPSLEMLLSSQYQYTAARMESGGVWKPSRTLCQGFWVQAVNSRNKGIRRRFIVFSRL